MSISDNYVPDVSVGNGVTVAFSGSWNVIASTYFVCQLQNIATGALTTLNVPGSDGSLAFTSSGYTATLNVAPSSSYNVIRSRNITKDQIVPYKTSTGFQGLVEENSFDKITAITQDLQENINRSLLFPLGSSLTGVLPIPQDGYGLIWSGTGGTLVNTSVSLAILQTQAAALYTIAGNITTVAGISANVTSVAANAGNINTVAGSIGNVNTVAGSIAAVNAVNADLTNINSVVSNATNINTVAGISANVTTVAGISANVTSVAGNATNINAVAADTTNINAVAGDLANINAVKADLTNIDSAVSNATNINTVAGISSNVTTVAGISANVTTVAGISANVTTVAGISGNVTTVAGDHTAINTVAGDHAAINTVSTDHAIINTVSGIHSDVTTVAGISGNVTTVAGISANVTTVAGVSANVTTVATNIANVNTVATNMTTITNAANNIPKANLSASVAPGVGNDNTQGYSAGSIWCDTTHNQVYICTNAATGAAVWNQAFAASTLAGLGDVSVSGLASHDTLQYNTGTSKWNNVAAATALSNMGGAPLASPALTGTPTVPTATAGTNTTQAASTAFAMTAAANAAAAANAGLQANFASTANITGTYTPVASGIGDTFTVTATGVLIVDGHTAVAGEVFFYKNDTSGSGAYNGLYKVTVAGSLGVSPILTRSLNYDQASDINNVGAIAITNGTVNAGASYILTTKVTNVGSDALTYTIFTPPYASILQSGGNAGTPSAINLTNGTALPDGGLTLTDVTTNNVSTSRHGFMPKAVNTAGLYYDAQAGQTNPALNSVLTGYTSGAGTVAATDTILGAIQKLNGNAPRKGATTSSGSSNLTLTASSNLLQMRTMTAAGLSIVLPDATTMAAGDGGFILKNTGTYQFSVIDNAGNIKGLLCANESMIIMASDVSTSAGVWASGELGGFVSDLFGVSTGSGLVLTGYGASGCNYVCVCPISSTTAFICANDQTATAAVKGAVLTISGETITVGTVATIQTLAAVSGLSCCLIDSTHILVSMGGTSHTYVQTVSISGTTVTANTSQAVESSVSHNHYLFPISSSSAYLAYSLDTGTKSAGVVITSANTTTPVVQAITYGAATIVAASGNLSVCQLSTTAYCYVYAGTTGYLAAQIFTVSGNVVTANAGITNQSNSVAQTNIFCTNFGANCVVVFSSVASTANFNCYVFTVSGTTITLAQAIVGAVAAITASNNGYALNTINPSSGVFTFYEATQASTGKLRQVPFKVDPINGDIQFEPTITTGYNNYNHAGASYGVGAYPTCGSASTLTGKWILAHFDSTATKPLVQFMNVVI